MMSWIAEYWLLCAIAVVIGIATGWWIWAQAAPAAVEAAPVAAPEKLVAAKPEIVPAAPAQFVAAPAQPVAAPAPPPGMPAIAAAVGAPDNLELIKGVGPKLNALLISLGVTRFDQIAAWGAAEIGEVDAYLGSFKGRITRDNWVEQAELLAAGDTAGFAAKFGALGSEIKG